MLADLCYITGLILRQLKTDPEPRYQLATEATARIPKRFRPRDDSDRLKDRSPFTFRESAEPLMPIKSAKNFR